MPAKHNFEAELSSVEALRNGSPADAVALLARALDHRNNLIVSKAAAVALHHQSKGLRVNLAAAFLRFLENPKADPQCWAKNAIARTLADFEYQEQELWLSGMRHIQMEPVWGGSSDTAGPLRSTCALALVQCRELNSHRLLVYLTPLLADKELPVRINAVRAIEQAGSDSAALLLRLLAELGGREPELLGACYCGVLALEGTGAIDWAARFLHAEDDAAGEAAMAIAQTHTVEAFQVLRSAFTRSRDPWFRTTVLAAIALTRRQEATDWLLELIANEDDGSSAAHEALCRSAPSSATQERLQELGRPCVEKPAQGTRG